MKGAIADGGTLKATISNSGRLRGQVEQDNSLQGVLGLPEIVYGGDSYNAGNGIVINNYVISLDSLIIDCGRGTTVE